MLDRGHDVVVTACDNGRGAEIKALGFGFEPLPMSRHGTRIRSEVRTLEFLSRLYRRLRPALVHHVSTKAVVYGSMAARIASPSTAVVNAITGVGLPFSGALCGAKQQFVLRRLYRGALSHPRSTTIFQNDDDLSLFESQGLVNSSQAVVIRGAGVDLEVYRPADSRPAGPPLVVMASRLLRSKGFDTFIDAARILDRKNDARFAVVGGPDAGNTQSYDETEIRALIKGSGVEWWGHRDDMPQVLRQADIFVLPSRYPEGVPKVLLEAAASGCALVTADVPGCRDVVEHGRNGFLVPRSDPDALAGSIGRLLDDAALRRRFGEESVKVVEARFSLQQVVEETLQSYDELLGTDARFPVLR